MNRAKQILIGVSTSPKVVASARAFALYALPIAIQLLVGYLAGLTDPRWLGVPLASTVLIRAVGEALIDQLQKPQQNAVNPPPVAGSGDGNPAGNGIP